MSDQGMPCQPFGEHRFFRFLVRRCRSETSDSVQLSQIQFRRHDGEVLSMRSAMVKNPHGLNPEGHNPRKSVDGHIDTTWMDFNKGPLIVTFPAAVNVTGFRFVTGDDTPERDPVAWVLEGSANELDWVLLHEQETPYQTPTARRKATGWFGLHRGPRASKRNGLSAKLVSQVAVLQVDPWTTEKWLESLSIAELLAGTLNKKGETSQFDSIRELGRQGDKSAILRRLSESNALEHLAQLLFVGAQDIDRADGCGEFSNKAVSLATDQALLKKKVAVDSTVESVRIDVTRYLDTWVGEEELLKSRQLVNASLAEIVNKRLQDIELWSVPEALREDTEVSRAITEALNVKGWLVGARAIETPFDLFRLLRKGSQDMLIGQQMWMQDDYEAMVRSFGELGTDSPLFFLATRCLGKTCKVVGWEDRLSCAWCKVEGMDEEQWTVSGLDEALKRAKAFEQQQAEFFRDLATEFRQSTGMELVALFQDLRAGLSKGQVLLPLSALMPEEQEYDKALEELPESEKAVAVRLLVARFLSSKLQQDEKLRFLTHKSLSALMGGKVQFLSRLRQGGGRAALEKALPDGVIHERVKIGPKVYAEQRITASDCREAGLHLAEMPDLGLHAEELEAAWSR